MEELKIPRFIDLTHEEVEAVFAAHNAPRVSVIIERRAAYRRSQRDRKRDVYVNPPEFIRTKS